MGDCKDEEEVEGMGGEIFFNVINSSVYFTHVKNISKRSHPAFGCL